MVELTQQQVLSYNSKVEEARRRTADSKAKKELAEREMTRLCGELSELLGREITSETLDAEYAKFSEEAQRTMESGTRILAGMQREAEACVQAVPKASAPVVSTPAGAPDRSVELGDLFDML